VEHLVVDTNIIAASFLESEEFHERAKGYIDALEGGDSMFHLPMLVAVEVMAVISRRPQRFRQALLLTWRQNLIDWERDGKLALYPLDRDRMERSLDTADHYKLRGSDSIIAALSQELSLPLKTFDQEILARYLQASV
jgi:predicted nucleic acid-binding protein